MNLNSRSYEFLRQCKLSLDFRYKDSQTHVRQFLEVHYFDESRSQTGRMVCFWK